MSNDTKSFKRDALIVGCFFCLTPFFVDYLLILGSRNSLFIDSLVFLRMGSFLSPLVGITIIAWMIWRVLRASRWLIATSIVIAIFVLLSLCLFAVKEWRKQALIDSFDYAVLQLSNAKQLIDDFEGADQKRLLEDLINNCSQIKVSLINVNYIDRRYDFILMRSGSVIGTAVLSYKNNQPILNVYAGNEDTLAKHHYDVTHQSELLNCQ
jgi:hypothetical protein